MKPIPGFPSYQITRDGRIWSEPGKSNHCKGKWLRAAPSTTGRLKVTLRVNNKGFACYIHRLVLETYVGSCPEGMEACHNNGNYLDNRIENLRWDTRSNNHKDAIKYGTLKNLFGTGTKHPQAKLTETKAKLIRYLHGLGMFTYVDLAWQFDVTPNTIRRIVLRKNWKHI